MSSKRRCGARAHSSPGRAAGAPPAQISLSLALSLSLSIYIYVYLTLLYIYIYIYIHIHICRCLVVFPSQRERVTASARLRARIAEKIIKARVEGPCQTPQVFGCFLGHTFCVLLYRVPPPRALTKRSLLQRKSEGEGGGRREGTGGGGEMDGAKCLVVHLRHLRRYPRQHQTSVRCDCCGTENLSRDKGVSTTVSTSSESGRHTHTHDSLLKPFIRVP